MSSTNSGGHQAEPGGAQPDDHPRDGALPDEALPDEALPDEALPDEQELPERVAELAGELTETESPSLRPRLARQIAQLATRTGHAAGTAVRPARDAATRGYGAARDAAARRHAPERGPAARPYGPERGPAQRPYGPATAAGARKYRPARDTAARRFQASRDAAVHGIRVGGSAAKRGVQASSALTMRGARVSGGWLTHQVLVMAPKVPVRGNATLRAQHPGMDTDEVADALIRGAARASAAVGGAIGVAAALPLIPSATVELGVETLALVGIELKLIAELHEIYGMPAPGSAPQRAMAYVQAWAERRGVRITTEGVALAVGSPMRRKLEQRLVAKAGQSALTLAPLLAGAVAGSVVDHRETRRLGTLVRDDLRKRAVNR